MLALVSSDDPFSSHRMRSTAGRYRSESSWKLLSVSAE